MLDRIKGAEYSVINMNRDNVEVPFRRTYSPSSPGTAPPLSFDTRLVKTEKWKSQTSESVLQSNNSIYTESLFWDTFRYIVRSGISGFYCYAIYERPLGCIASDLIQMRMVFKLRCEK